jgi:RimJ/RimL family protein N-acetyltransferase
MATVEIPTARLTLVLQTPDEVLAQIEAMSPADRAEVSPGWIARVRATAVGDPWALGFAAVERASGSVVGGCGYKGPPDGNGVVEITYGINPEYRGRGYATEAARALAQFAFASGRAQLVCAHSRPENTASARVLEKSGLTLVGQVTDPEDGLVCRWELVREPAEGKQMGEL